MPSLVMLQNAHNEIFYFLVDEAARCFVHFCGKASSHRFRKQRSAVFALTGYAMLYSAKPTCAMLQVLFSGKHFCLLVSGRGLSHDLNNYSYAIKMTYLRFPVYL